MMRRCERDARIYAVLFDPALVLDYIEDPYLKLQVESYSRENSTGSEKQASPFMKAGSHEANPPDPERKLTNPERKSRRSLTGESIL